LAIGYLPDGQSNFGHLPRFGGPDGGIVTNVADLRRFFQSLTNGRFLSESVRQFLWQPVSRLNESSAYGHGFDILSINDQHWYGHTGGDPGVSAQVAFSADGESSIIVLCNVGSLAFKVFRLVSQPQVE
jgi:CubicO group peptidase (beta-lactamase class C family)